MKKRLKIAYLRPAPNRSAIRPTRSLQIRRRRAATFHDATIFVRGPGFEDDPLLFVESIPWRESRLFVERVLTNFWIYRERLREDSPSLDAAATGHWPIYFNLDKANEAVARNAGN